MGQAALKSRSHRRYYLNKVLPFLSLFGGGEPPAFFSPRASAAPVNRYENIDAIVLSLKGADYYSRF